MKRILFVLVALSLFLGACGAQTETIPAVNAEDVQATAVSMAWTMAAQTLEAMPTATLTPTKLPTNTPVPPTATPLETATPVATFTPVPTATVEKAACDQPLMSWGGQSAPIVVDNRTNEKISYISIHVSYTARGECGYVTANPSSFTVPIGCFYAYAGMTGKKNYSVGGGTFCINNPDKWILVIKEDQIVLKAP